jgi:tripartite-type tricarboxylate transporter receptor subunit TctC
MQAARTEALSGALAGALRQPDVVARLASLGLLAAPESAAEMASRLAADKARWEPVIRSTGFQAD